MTLEQLLQALGGMGGGQWDRSGFDVLRDLAERPADGQRLPAQEADAFGRAIGYAGA